VHFLIFYDFINVDSILFLLKRKCDAVKNLLGVHFCKICRELF